MDRFVNRENVKRYRRLASETTNAAERSRIMKLLAEQTAKFKLELRRRGDGPEELSPFKMATACRFEDDGEEQRSGG